MTYLVIDFRNYGKNYYNILIFFNLVKSRTFYQKEIKELFFLYYQVVEK